MFCQFCKVEIPASWSKVIASNKCPNCEESIISDESRKIMDELKDAISKMSATPDELVGWLMSTYDLFPKGAVQPTTFHRKPGENIEAGNLKYANTPTNEFRKRAGVDKFLENPKFAAIAQAINNVNSIDSNNPYESDFEQEDQNDTSEQDKIAILAAKAKIQGKKLTMKEILSNSTDFNIDSGPELSGSEIEIMKQAVGGSSMLQDNDMEGIENLPPALQKDRLKRLAAQRELKFGGSTGKIKRAE
jgi:hypothetical protein